MLKILEKIQNYINFISNLIINTVSFFLILLIIYAVFNRYFIKDSMSWYEEISIFLYRLLVYWGLVMIAKDDTHLSVDILISKFSGKVQNYFKIIIWSFNLFITLFGTYFAFKMSQIYTMKTVALKIPSSIINFSTMAMSFMLMSFIYLYKIIRYIKEQKDIQIKS